MHEWHTKKSRNPLDLILNFIGFKFETDCGERQEVTNVMITNKMFDTEEETRTRITNASYGGETAYLAAYTTKKLSKAYHNAYNTFITRYDEYMSFKRNLNIAYGRKSSKVTCPSCGSSINLKYGKRFVNCPICGSDKIISDSNWKTLDTKLGMAKRAADNLAKEATKNDVMFMCGIEWHC